MATKQQSTSSEFGIWTDHRNPKDRGGWYPLVRQFFDYWLLIRPPGQMPGRQHLLPEAVAPMLPHVWMVDVHREPLRYRFRLCGTAMVRSLGREVTGAWVDEVQPRFVANPEARDRFRMVVETGCPTWRRGPSLWLRDPKHYVIESCVVPLAADGHFVDKLFGIGIAFTSTGSSLLS